MKVIFSGSQHRAYSALLKDFSERYCDRERYLVFASDRYTLQCEKDFLRAAGKKAAMNINVTTFRRYASGRTSGYAPLSPEAAVMLMNKVALEKNNELCYYRDSTCFSGFSNDIFKTIVALRASGVTPTDLKKCAEKMGGVSGAKTRDLVVLYEGLLSKMSHFYADGTAVLERLLAELKRDPPSPLYKIYIAEFITFNAQIRDLIAFFEQNGNEVVLTMPSVDVSDELSFVYPLERNRAALDLFEKIGTVQTVSAELVDEEEKLLFSELYSFKQPSSKRRGDRFSAYVAPDRRSEVAFLATGIKKLATSGVRYGEITVICSALEPYIGLIKEIFSFNGINYHMDIPYELSDHAFFRFINDALELVRVNFRQEEYLTFLKNPLLDIDPIARAEFENYVLKYNVDHNRFLTPFSFGDESEFSGPEQVRTTVCELLSELSAGKNANNVSAVIAALSETFMRLSAEQRLESFAAKLSEVGDDTGAAITRRIYQKTVELLGEFDSLLGTERIPLRDFINMLKQSAAEVKVNLLPLTLDSVLVRETSTAVIPAGGYVFVLGADSANFPKVNGESSVITLRDVREWKKNRIDFYPTPVDNNRLERYYILQILLSGAKRFTFLRSGTGYASTIVKRLTELYDFSETAVDKFAYKVGKGKIEKDMLDVEKLSADKIKKMYLGDPCTSSVSQLETYFKCPYLYFVKYGLKLCERESARIDNLNFGSIAHEVLARYYTPCDRYKPLVDPEKIKKRVTELTDATFSGEKFSRFREARDYAMIRNAVIGECSRVLQRLERFAASSEFKPVAVEQGFGFGYSPAISIDLPDSKQQVSLKGFIDRVDAYRDKFFIIDYKTGGVDSGLDNVFTGKKLQLFIYLDAVAEMHGNDEKMTPVGTFYIKIGASSDATLFDGKLLEDLDMFPSLTDVEGLKEYFGVKLKRDGTVDGHTRSSVLNADQMEYVRRYVFDLSGRALKEIIDGYIAKKPMDEECKYCPLKGFCDADGARKAFNGFKTLWNKEA